LIEGPQPSERGREEIADAQRVQDDGERIDGLPKGPENGPDHKGDKKVNALIAEKGTEHRCLSESFDQLRAPCPAVRHTETSAGTSTPNRLLSGAE
jgi:hypothetical protein